MSLVILLVVAWKRVWIRDPLLSNSAWSSRIHEVEPTFFQEYQNLSQHNLNLDLLFLANIVTKLAKLQENIILDMCDRYTHVLMTQ